MSESDWKFVEIMCGVEERMDREVRRFEDELRAIRTNTSVKKELLKQLATEVGLTIEFV